MHSLNQQTKVNTMTKRTEITDSLQNSKNKWNIILTSYKVLANGDEYECGVGDPRIHIAQTLYTALAAQQRDGKEINYDHGQGI